MRCFPMSVSRSARNVFEIRSLGYPPTTLQFRVPKAAERVLDRVLAPYDETTHDYFHRVSRDGSLVSLWAFICLDREYALAGHIATARPADAGLLFAPYRYKPITPGPKPTLAADIPQVGMIAVPQKRGLKAAASRSPIFGAAWQAVKHRDARRHWLVVLDPLPEEWLKSALPADAERWVSRPAETMAGR